MTIPGWPPRDWRAFIALAASILGAIALTGFSFWIVRMLGRFARDYPETRGEVVKALANSNYGLLGIIGAILLSLGLAINRRSVKGSAFGASFEASGGDDDAKADTLAEAGNALSGRAVELNRAAEIKGEGP